MGDVGTLHRDERLVAAHDERNSGAYGTDSRPPGTPVKLRLKRRHKVLRLTWTAPGDDWMCGRAKRFRVLVSRRRIVHPRQGRVLSTVRAGRGAGKHPHRTLRRLGRARWVALQYQDDAGNWGHVSKSKRLPRRR